MGDGFLIKRYSVSVDGFGPHSYFAASAGKARAAAWRAYCSYSYVSFKEFLGISRILHMGRAGTQKRFGERIRVGGELAFFVEDDGHYIHFVRPGADTIMLSHPNDVGGP